MSATARDPAASAVAPSPGGGAPGGANAGGASVGAGDGAWPPAIQPFRRAHVAWLVGITLLAALLRLYRLPEWSLWVDEAHTWRDATMPFDDFLRSNRAWYPGSYLGLRWLLELGVLRQLTEGWLRLPFAFCGIVSVPLLALFGNLLVGRRAALLAALFLAINPWHIYWSQNARGYVLVLFWAILACGTFWVGVQRRSRWWLGTALVCMLAGAACHPTGLLLLPVMAAYPLLARGNLAGRRFWLTTALAGAALLLLPWVLGMVPPFQVFMHAKSDASFAHLVSTTAFYFRVPLLFAALTGVWLLFQTRIEGRVLFLACWALVPLLVLGVVGVSVVKVTARYAFCALPAVMLLAGAASVRMADALASGLGGGPASGRGWSRLLPTAVLPAILCVDMAAYDYLYFETQNGDRGLWRQAADVAQKTAGARPLEVLTINQPSLLYYLRPNHYRYQQQPTDPHVGIAVHAITSWEVFGDGRTPPPPGGWGGQAYLRSRLQAARAAKRQLVVIVTLPELIEIDADGSLQKTLRTEFELAEVLPCWVGPKDETIYVYRPR